MLQLFRQEAGEALAGSTHFTTQQAINTVYKEGELTVLVNTSINILVLLCLLGVQLFCGLVDLKMT